MTPIDIENVAIKLVVFKNPYFDTQFMSLALLELNLPNVFGKNYKNSQIWHWNMIFFLPWKWPQMEFKMSPLATPTSKTPILPRDCVWDIGIFKKSLF